METLQHCWWQILLAGLAYFVLGAVWYNQKVLGTLWQKSHNLTFTEEQMKAGLNPVMMLFSLVCTIVMSAVICYFCYNISGNMGGAACAGSSCWCGGFWLCLKIGLLLGLGTAFASMSMGYIYQQKPLNAYLIDGGYHVIGNILAAMVLHLTCCF